MTGPAAQYPIRAVAKLTGLSIDTLRAWERRYGAVTPVRDGRGRLYSADDVERLRLLQRAVAAGHSIGRAATLGAEALRALTAERSPASAAPPADFSAIHAALRRLDGVALDRELAKHAATLPPIRLVEDVLLPAMRDAGGEWHRVRGGIASEHVMSATLRHLLGTFLRLYARDDRETRLLFATPSGDRHEVGILAAAMLAASHGVGVTYLGPDLPADEILAARDASGATVVVLGVTMEDAPGLSNELQRLAGHLPPNVELWLGGAAAVAQAHRLGARATTIADFAAFTHQLDHLARRSA